jgi:radical SAM-linked protein
MIRLRITFSKSGSLRYTGHLDLHRIWERTVRRTGLPLAYSQGFHPGPKIQLASALPLGFIGRAEIVDIWLHEYEPISITTAKDMLQSATPPGLVISAMEEVDAHDPALQTQVLAADYLITLLDPVDLPALEKGIASLLEATNLIREWRGKRYDLRPLIEALDLVALPTSEHKYSSSKSGEDHPSCQIHMRLSAREAATGRPEQVLEALSIPFETTRIERTGLIFK